jgi:lipopolysaccharide export system protein LptA
MKKKFALPLLSLVIFNANAEKADSLKQAQISARSVDADRVTQTNLLIGDVILTRGTLIMKSEKAVVKEADDGYMLVILTTTPGKLVTFRQKKDGGPDMWVESQAKRIEYEERTDMVKLFNKATIKNLEGTRLSNQIDGEFISYDSRKEVAVARNDSSGESKAGQGRVTMVLAPRRRTAAAPAPVAPAVPAADKK